MDRDRSQTRDLQALTRRSGSRCPLSQAEFIGRLIDGLARGGTRRAVLSPGYRNAPVALALRAHPQITTTVIVDERAAAFYALGLSRASSAPVILSCTSGSALANYLPAIVEAHRDRIPLVILSADRPAELQRAGAPQTMAQREIFANFVVFSDELAEPAHLDEDLMRTPWHTRVAMAISAATADEGGPVHINLPLRKPLLPETLPPPTANPPQLLCGRRQLDRSQLGELCDHFAGAERPLIVVGPMIREAAGESAAQGAALVRLAERSGWPLLADLLATCRPEATQVGDAIARQSDSAAPDAILWFGDAPISAALLRFIDRCPGPVARIGTGRTWRDPSFKTSLAVQAAPADTADALDLPKTSESWRRSWQRTITDATQHLDSAREHGRFEGPVLAQALAAWPGNLVHVANSTSIRDLDTFGHLRPGQRVLCNRGLNGIDGTIATAAGEAASLAQPLLTIIGDLALAHDIGALMHTPDTQLVLLVINNGGGQIFRQLPVREHPAFAKFFMTAMPTDLRTLAAATAWAYTAIDDDDGGNALTEALQAGYERGRSIIELHFDADAAFTARQSFWSAW
ncbi:MAG TPA: 2-succinyl-5-enolpyruvyl-6-hydroxy-3-cyclohexene-1-carboxylic-acid synthase [Nannocystis exedens]|nr:2-succinyl-5-enolpyruvyl-6-hydroxy-3-cyclohexene-1-carboxylic-acid synthase [Nannocystis exedens]